MVKDEKVQTKSLIKASTEEKFDMIVEINDSILDRVGNLLDDAEGLKKKNEDLIITSLNVPSDRKQQFKFTKWNEKSSKSSDEHIQHQVIRKPQLDFEDKIDNFGIFEPTIKFKHNSIKQLSIIREYNENDEYYYPNPYEVEITSYKLPEKYLKSTQPKMPKPIDRTYFKYIDAEKDLNELLEYLKTIEEFAVDLEYHAQRSFLGFTCLVQISSRDRDFIIDAIKLRSQMSILNEVFTDPKILKVFHGADLDVRWLQKDFGIYVVNMFDTGKAAKLLHFASFSLSFLVKHYCNENLIKKYQLADWRIRPLSEGMLNYARSDTHSLLYIFDKIRNDLIKKEGIESLKQAFEESRKVSLLRFEIPTINENSYLALIMKNRLEFNNRQKQAFKEIYSWRDHLARSEDESTNYILPNHMMLKIAEVLPKEQQGILACCNPIPVMVKKHLNELHLIVLRARELPLQQSTNNVYSLKPIVNQIIDITSNMDILDEEHVDEHHLVSYDCLMDTPEMQHKIKLTRKSCNDKKNLLCDFLAIKYSNESKRMKGQMPYEMYCKVIEKKRKEMTEKVDQDQEIEIDIDQVPEIVSKEITNEPSRIQSKTDEDKEFELTERLKSTALIDLKKKKKKSNIKPDIPCEVNKSIDKLISNAMVDKNDQIETVNLDDEEDSDEEQNETNDSKTDEFNYNQADYSIFSDNKQQNKYFDPSEKFLRQKVSVRLKIFLNDL